MRKLLFSIVIVATISVANAQTSGTNTVGLGLVLQSQKIESNSLAGYQTSKVINRSFSLGYGRFVKDNVRIGMDLTYGEYDYTNSIQKFYGGKVNYQKYIPLLKKFYAFGGGRAGYNYSKINDDNNNPVFAHAKTNSYSAGGYGGLSWFLSKRFAIEADLLSANVIYSKTKEFYSDSPNNRTQTTTSTNFNLTTEGAINNLGFKIYFLF